MLTGIDVSDFQGTVDWHKVATAGHTFAFTKATEGTGFVATSFVANWHAIKDAGLVRGAYHFGHPGSDAKAQADFFVRVVDRQGYGAGDLPLVLDLEQTDGKTPAQINVWTQEFMTRVQQLIGRKPILYTGAYFYTGPSMGWPLWLPSYYDDLHAPWHGVKPKLPPGYKNWTFWQHTSKGVVSGIAGRVDMNVFAGTLDDLKKLAGVAKPVGLSLADRLKKAGLGVKSVITILKKLGR